MRILFDSKNLIYKTPFGCVRPEELCTLRIHIPVSVGTTAVSCVLQRENGAAYQEYPFVFEETRGLYHIWVCRFSLTEPGLFFYWFRITGNTGIFRLFKQGNDTNMEAGGLWQLSCIPATFTTPDWAKGAVIYQVFPDRFSKSGQCDLTGKLTPYVLHESWQEEVFWQPDEKGEILNNDFYGGNFQGITEKLDYIASLGTTVLYLNPISKSFSSHRYDTGDYKTPDPMLGTEADFARLCREAHARGIRVILDGVYSHTGSDSLYFDREGHFGGRGAYAAPDSPYRSWYTFHRYPDEYNSWWGFDTLPTVNKLDPAFLDYIIESDDSVIAHWLRLGADSFRLDVADELPNEFMDRIKKRLRALRPDSLLMGEVWEDASNKIAYDIRRRYFVDGTLDSVMNYPFRTAILRFLRYEEGAESFRERVMTIYENYPRQVLHCNMNLLGTHDTPRILTALVDDYDGPREEMAVRRLPPSRLQLAKDRLLTATALQFTLPGSPSIYYGDEAGMEGGKDPFNRRPFPWGAEDERLVSHYRQLGGLRKDHPALRLGDLEFITAEGGLLGYRRVSGDDRIALWVNRTDTPQEISGHSLYGYNMRHSAPDGVTLLSGGFCIMEE